MDEDATVSGVQKELKTFYDGTRKANLEVEIGHMLSLAGRYDTRTRLRRTIPE